LKCEETKEKQRNKPTQATDAAKHKPTNSKKAAMLEIWDFILFEKTMPIILFVRHDLALYRFFAAVVI
jgi:hypothetical protein